MRGGRPSLFLPGSEGAKSVFDISGDDSGGWKFYPLTRSARGALRLARVALTVREDSTKSAGEKSPAGIYFFHRRRFCGKLPAGPRPASALTHEAAVFVR